MLSQRTSTWVNLRALSDNLAADWPKCTTLLLIWSSGPSKKLYFASCYSRGTGRCLYITQRFQLSVCPSASPSIQYKGQQKWFDLEMYAISCISGHRHIGARTWCTISVIGSHGTSYRHKNQLLG